MILRIIFCGLILLLSSCIFMDDREKHEKIANKLSSKISRELQQKFHVRQAGSGGGMRGAVNLICLSYEYRKPTMTQDEARALIVPMLQLFLQRINEDEEIRPYLKNYPFRIENVEISISVHDYEGGMLVDPSVGIITGCLGRVGYSILTPDGKYNFEGKYRESFDEAVERYDDQLRAKNISPVTESK